MATVDKVVCTWSGAAGLPGFTVFYLYSATATKLTKIDNWWATFKNLIPINTSFSRAAEGYSYDDVTGALTGTWAAGSVVSQGGTETGKYSAPTGVVTTWKTGVTRPARPPGVGGRMLKGRTFIVPAAGLCFDTDGSLTSTYRTVFQGAAATLISDLAGSLAVWGRPQPGWPGLSAPVTGYSVPDMAAVLRSRRP